MPPETKLEHVEEFQEILDHYRPSADSIAILEEVELVLLLAPTSSGRNTIIRELTDSGDYEFIVSDTTRVPRKNNGVMERDGVEYWFRSEEEILQDLRDGKFLEAEIIHGQQISGISIRELEKAKDLGKVAITDVDILGVENIVAAKPDTIAILVLPPSFEEWQRRINSRGEMDKEELRRRLTTASRIFEAALKHDYYKLVINDNLEEATKEVDELVRSNGKVDSDKQEEAHRLTEQLFAATQEYLLTH